MSDEDRRYGMDERLRQMEIKFERVAQRVDDHEGDIHRFAALPSELHEIRWTLDGLKQDVTGAHDAIRGLSAKLDEERQERVDGQALRKKELEEAQAARDLELKRMEAAREQENAARDLEMKRMEATREQQNREMRSRLLVATIALIGVFLTAAGGVLVQLLSGGGG